MLTPKEGRLFRRAAQYDFGLPADGLPLRSSPGKSLD